MACAYLVEQFQATGYSLKTLPRGAAAGVPMRTPAHSLTTQDVDAELCSVSN
jgi:hypothetical protein